MIAIGQWFDGSELLLLMEWENDRRFHSTACESGLIHDFF